MWQDISREAFHRIFVQRLEQAMEDTDVKQYKAADLPICSVCDAVSLDCAPLPSCAHPACPKCLAMVRLSTACNTAVCRICLKQESEELAPGSAVSMQNSTSSSSRKDENQLEQSSLKKELHTASVQHRGETATTQESQQKEVAVPTARKEAKTPPRGKAVAQRVREPEKETQSLSKEEEGAEQCVAEAREAVESARDVPTVLGQVSMGFAERKSCSLPESVAKVQQALSAATKYSHCASCLQAKKSQAPDLFCLECALSFCFRCSSRHKSTASNSGHMTVPVEGRRGPGRSSPPGTFCPRHIGSELGLYCRNCEMLVCRECVVHQHLGCPGVMSAEDHAREERETVKRCRVKYAQEPVHYALQNLPLHHEQVMRFFSEQRRDTEETRAALNVKKRDFQGDIRKYFSMLIKACMDVEATLLEELETSVSDHIDLLTDQSSAWLNLQESMQQLLDITDTLNYLPTPDFLLLSMASSASLSQALREGEALAAVAPPEMTLGLSLEQSSQRSVIKRIKEIGAVALTVSTHKTMILRKVTSVSFRAPHDKDEPLVTGMALLTQTVLVAADFNNSCLKLLHTEGAGEGWNVVDVLPLKWRPYSIVKLSEKHVLSPPGTDQPDEQSDSKQPIPSSTVNSSPEEGGTSAGGSSQQLPHRGFSLERQTAVTLNDEEIPLPLNVAELEVQVAVSSPFAGCFIITVPVFGNSKMSIVRPISEEKGCWGVAVVDEHTLAASTVDCGRSYISLMATDKNMKKRLSLTSDTTLAPLVSPRHIIATSPSSILVCDHGKKAAIHISCDGKILFTYTGQGNQRLTRPEGLCMDGHGHVFITDSSDHSVSVITKTGQLFSKTGSQQSELNCPQAVCMDRNSCLYVANHGGKQLTIFDIIQEG